MVDLATVSRAKLRHGTMLQHPIYLYQVNLLGKGGPDEPLDDDQDDARTEFEDRFNAGDWQWKISPIAEAVTGMRAGEESELRWSTCWPSDRFTRDDIDSPDVQRGFRKADVHPVVRSMVAIEDAALYNVKGQTRLRVEGPDPFLVGFASTYLEAARWVATGSGKHFLPWPVSA